MSPRTRSAPRVAGAAAWTRTLGDVPLFAGLPDRQLRKVARLGTIQHFPAKIELVKKGTAGSAAYIVLEGSCEIVRGRGQPRITIGPGSIVGEMALLDGAPRSATVVTSSELTALCLGRSSLAALLREEPTVTLRILATLAGRLRAAERDAASV